MSPQMTPGRKFPADSKQIRNLSEEAVSWGFTYNAPYQLHDVT